MVSDHLREYKKQWAMKNKERVKANNQAWRAANKEKAKARVYKWKHENPEATRRQASQRRVERYGITYDQYEQMLVDQNNLCLVCGRPESYPGRRLAVDHCHTTNKVRGLLCGLCNRTLGVYERHKSAFDAYLVERG